VAYSDAFDKSLKICLYIAAVNLVVNLFTWQRDPKPMKGKNPGVEEKAEESEKTDEES
jgi:hypothetical protein